MDNVNKQNGQQYIFLPNAGNGDKREKYSKKGFISWELGDKPDQK